MTRLKRRTGKSFALQEVCAYIDQIKLLILQLVNKRFYLSHVAAILSPICIFTRKGLRLNSGSPSIDVFSPTSLEWEALFVRNFGEDLNNRLENFKRYSGPPTNSKIV